MVELLKEAEFRLKRTEPDDTEYFEGQLLEALAEAKKRTYRASSDGIRHTADIRGSLVAIDKYSSIFEWYLFKEGITSSKKTY